MKTLARFANSGVIDRLVDPVALIALVVMGLALVYCWVIDRVPFNG